MRMMNWYTKENSRIIYIMEKGQNIMNRMRMVMNSDMKESL